MSRIRITTVVGTPRHPSRTLALTDALQKAIAAKLDASFDVMSVKDVWPHLCEAMQRAALSPIGESVIRRIESADVLIVASPVYRASYTGMLKHVFDLVDQYALKGKPVILCATGGSERHALVIEHQLAPLVRFFGMLIMPSGIYAAERDFKDFTLREEHILLRIENAADELFRILSHN